MAELSCVGADNGGADNSGADNSGADTSGAVSSGADNGGVSSVAVRSGKETGVQIRKLRTDQLDASPRLHFIILFQVHLLLPLNFTYFALSHTHTHISFILFCMFEIAVNFFLNVFLLSSLFKDIKKYNLEERVSNATKFYLQVAPTSGTVTI